MIRLAVLAFLLCSVGAELADKPDCSKIGDGLHAVGCSSDFYACYNNEAFYTRCPSGLYFDPLTKTCRSKDEILICAETSDPKPDCSKVGDGIYAMQECSSSYYVCSDNRLDVMNCTDNLYFDPISRLCDFKFKVAICKAENREDGKPDCSKVDDEVYSNGCSDEYYHCMTNRLYHLRCGSGLYFNPISEHCDRKENVPICNSVNDFKLDCSKIAPGWYAKGCSSDFHGCFDNELLVRKCAMYHYFNQLTHSCETKDKVPICNNAKPDCSKGDGVFPRKCTNRFFMCENNQLFDMICPSGTLINPVTKKCEMKELEPSCMVTIVDAELEIGRLIVM